MVAPRSEPRAGAAGPTWDGRRLAVGLLSAAITAHQLGLMQVLAYVHWHHFAYMVVAVALLGFGAAGTVLTLWRQPLLGRARPLLPWLALAAGLTMPLGVSLSQVTVLAFDLHVLFVDPRQWLALGAAYAFLLPPFFLGGLGVSLVLTCEADRAGRYYFASLVGAGAGGVAGMAALEAVLPARLPAAAGLLAVAAALGVWADFGRRGRWIAVALSVASFGWFFRDAELRASEFKPVTRALDLPDARVEAQWPSVHGWLQIVAAPALRPAPPLSLSYVGELPPHPAVFVNGYSHGALLPPEHVDDPDWFDYTTDAVAYVGRRRERVLLLEPGPGGVVAHALASGADEVVVVEPHRTLARFLAAGGEAGTPAPEWAQPGVRVVASTGRRVLRQGEETGFDLIRFPAAGGAGGAGMTSATEEFLLTREAAREAWSRLSPQGALALTAPMEFPVRHPLRALAMLIEALEAEGITEPARHVVAVRGWSSVTYVVHREPVSAELAAAVRAFCEERSFDPLLLPDLRPEERNLYNVWPEPQFFAHVDALFGPRRQLLYEDYPFRIRPPTDERPWFAQFLQWSSLDELGEAFGQGRLPFFELGTLMVALTFAQLLVLAVVCIVLPLVRLGGVEPRRTGTVLYFAGLGAGFMLVEIGLMLRLHGWLGNPLASAAVVLVGLLFFAGLGSLLSERLSAAPRVRMRVTAACMGVIAIVAVILMGAGPSAWPWPAQVATALALMAPLGLTMGMAFPTGLRDLERRTPKQVPWAWGINGCVSVATPAGAMLVAMEAGVSALFLLAVLAYGTACLGAWIQRGQAASC